MANSNRSPFVNHSKEFTLIHQYFNLPSMQRQNPDSTVLGIGDDCALLDIPEHHQIAISTDTLVEHRHFLANTDAADIAYKAFMVSVSDLAAMGATPKWISLALTLPELKESWLSRFSLQLFALLDAYDMQLIGGDTTKGPLAITLTVQGIVPTNSAIRRAGAKSGDLIYVSGSLGNSALGLKLLSHSNESCDQDFKTSLDRRLILDTFKPPFHIDACSAPSKMNHMSEGSPDLKQPEKNLFNAILQGAYLYPKAQIELGLALRKIANSAIDISDGLASDLNHICAASRLAACVNLDRLPLSRPFTDLFAQFHGAASLEEMRILALTGGDDYQLCFTVDPKHKTYLSRLSEQLMLPLTHIGEMNESDEPEVIYELNGCIKKMALSGFDHFN